MKHNVNKTKEQLIKELAEMRQHVAELEALEIKHEQTEEALAQERNLLRTLIDNLPDYVYFKDTQGRFLIADTAVARLMGAVTPDELVGKTDFDFFPQTLATQYYADEQAVIASGQPLVNREEPVVDQITAEPRWLSTTKVPLRDGQDKIVGIVGMGRDITERKQAEQVLQQSKQQIQNILESITDAFFAVDNDWHFMYVNQRGEQILRKTRAELLHKSLWVEFPETVGSKFYTEYQRAMAEHVTVEFEEYYEPFQAWFKVHAYPYSAGLSVYFRDVTERKQAEKALQQSKQQVLNILDHLDELVKARTAELTAANEQLQQEIVERKRAEKALRESESKYRLLMEQASDGIFIADPHGNLLEVNPKGCEMLGYSLAKLLQLNFFKDLILAADLEVIPLHLDEVLAGKTILTERRLYCQNGALLPVEISAKMLADGRLQAIIRDITDRKQAQESLQRYAERLQTLQELDQAILSAQSPEAIAQAALHHMQRLVPFRQAAVVGFDFETYEVVMLAAYVHGQAKVMVGAHPPLDMFGIAEELRQSSVKTPENILTLAQPPLALQTLPAEGIRCYINVPLVAKGKLIGSLNLGTDTPDVFAPEHVDIAREVADPLAVAIQQARLHEQVQRYATELEQRVAERTAELEEINAELKSFSFSVSHDLRAPLRAVQGFATALLEDCAEGLDSVGQDYAQRIVAAAQRMDTLIQELLIYSRLSRTDLRLQPIDLTVVTTDVLTQLEAMIQEQKAQVSIKEPLPRVIGHYATLVQIMANLLTNGIKFVSPGLQPQVRIWTETPPTPPAGWGEKGGWVRLWVEDNGIGIEPEQQERIFQIFERLHGIEAYPGTGIGLAVVRKGVTRMGGHVGVESTVGQGSKFWLELPKAEE